MFFESELYALLTLFTDCLFSAESSKSSLLQGESKKEDAISPGRSTMDGELFRDGKPDQSERTKGVETQVGGSRAGLMKDSASSKNTLAEGTDESEKKDDIPSKDEILPDEGEPDNNVDLNRLRYFF